MSGMKTAMEVITSGIPELPCGQNCLPNVKQNLPRQKDMIHGSFFYSLRCKLILGCFSTLFVKGLYMKEKFVNVDEGKICMRNR